MKRVLIFLVLGPLLASAAVAMVVIAQAAGAPGREYAGSLVVFLFFFTLPVASLAASLDAYLALAFAIPLRALLIAAIGAIVASGLAYILVGCLLSPSSLKLFAIGGATCMGVCSLLANDYACQVPAVRANSLLRN